MASLKKYGGWILMAAGAVLLLGWGYTYFGKKESPGFGAAKKAA